MSDVLTADSQIVCPSHTIVTASAGAGKTYTLSWRFVQYLLSDTIPRNKLRNLLAVTFTRNAAREMKQRILLHLKRISTGDPESIEQATKLLGGDTPSLQRKAGEMINTILHNYSDFQVQTIDSFLERIFKSSMLDLKLPPDFGVELSSSRLFADAFSEYVENLHADKEELNALMGLVEAAESYRATAARFLWRPHLHIRDKAQALHDYVVTLDKDVERYNASRELTRIDGEAKAIIKTIQGLVVENGFDYAAYFVKMVDRTIGSGLKSTFSSASLLKPVKKGKHTAEEMQTMMDILKPHIGKLEGLIGEFVIATARGAHTPSLMALDAIQKNIDRIMWEDGRILIQDVSTTLNKYLKNDIVPEIYFRLGEQIHHFFIDEFQDTSPVQWAILRPLIENALSGQGSLFVVGDPKQSINLFRGADWQIMIGLNSDSEFPSSTHIPATLETNYRSGEQIVEYSRKLFCETLQEADRDAAHMSGLDAFEQAPRESMRGKGYTELISIPLKPELEDETDEEQEQTVQIPEEQHILRIVRDCRSRGFSYRDIGILAPRNMDIVQIGQWLNGAGIPFVSHSSLDVRHRKIAGELFALLTFLDSPVNDYAFAQVLLGDMFGRWLAREDSGIDNASISGILYEHSTSGKERPPLYKAFEEQYPEVFVSLFQPLLRVAGYLPTYDLLTASFSAFQLFRNFLEEESALVRILESAATGEGAESLKGYLALLEAEDDSGLWAMSIPTTLDAVQLMTIHKAKGLEFPVALVLVYDHTPPVPTYFKEDAGDVFRLLKLGSRTGDYDSGFGAMYEQHLRKERADALNRLYVAFTRPEQELYIVSVFKDSASAMPSHMLNAGPAMTGRKTDGYDGEQQHFEPVPLHHAAWTGAGAMPPARSLEGEEAVRGEWIHELLARIEFIDGSSADDFRNLLDELEMDVPEGTPINELAELLRSYFANETFRSFFQAEQGRSVYTELDVVDADGRLSRIDRLVVDGKEVSVIDFKTGNQPVSAYKEQVSRYRIVIRDLYPGLPVKVYLAFVDQGTVEEVVS